MSVDPALIAAHLARVHTPNFQLLVRWDGLNWVDESAFVVAMKGVESVGSGDAALNASEVNVDLNNDTRRYSADNPSSPIFSYLTHTGQKVLLKMGYNGHLIEVGTYFIGDLDPRESDQTASMRMVDRSGQLGDLKVNYAPQGHVRLDNVIRSMLVGLGAVEGVDFVLDVAESEAQFAAAVYVPLAHELQEIALAEGGRVYLDSAGVIRFMNRTNHLAALQTPKATFVRSEIAYDVSYARKQEGRVTVLVLEYEDRLGTVIDEVVFDQKTPIAIPPAYSYQYVSGYGADITHPDVVIPESVWIEPNVAYTYPDPADPSYGTPSAQQLVGYTDISHIIPGYTIVGGVEKGPPIFDTACARGFLSLQVKGMDMTRWERELPLLFTTINDVVANTAEDGSGTAVTVNAGAPSGELSGFGGTVSIQFTPDGPVGQVNLWNDTNATVWVRVLKLNGRPARTVSPWAVLAFDREAIDFFGVVEEKVQNAYLPTSDLGFLRAQDILFFRSGVRSRLDIPAMDGAPYMHPRDAFIFVDDSVSPAISTYLQVLRNDWSYSLSGGYSCSLTTAPALPPTTSVLDGGQVPALTDEAPSTTTDAGPWYWDDLITVVDVESGTSPWVASPISGYGNAAAVSAITGDAPTGGGSNSVGLTMNGAGSDQMAYLPLVGTFLSGVSHTITFWIKQASGSGSLQWFVGSLGTGADRVGSGGQTLTGGWVQKTVTWTPSANRTDAMLAIAGWGAITTGVRVDVVEAKATASVSHPLVWTWSDWG